jgi:hypothetical protein
MVVEWVRTCDLCQRRSRKTYVEKLFPTLVHTVGWEVYIDTIQFENHTQAVGGRCGLSGYCDGAVIKKKNASCVGKFMVEWITRYGPPVSHFIVDGGSEFLGEVRLYLEKMNIFVSVSSVGHPRANSVIERGWPQLREALVKWSITSGKPWHKFWRYAVWADNITVRTSTGYSPFELWYGRASVLPIEYDAETWGMIEWVFPMSRGDLLAARIEQIIRADERRISGAQNVNKNRLRDMIK